MRRRRIRTGDDDGTRSMPSRRRPVRSPPHLRPRDHAGAHGPASLSRRAGAPLQIEGPGSRPRGREGQAAEETERPAYSM